MSYIYVKDKEGFVVKKLQKDLQPDETVITKEEYETLSGDNYYKQTFGRGGKRKGAGRKLSTGFALKFQVRLSEQEKSFIKWAREHNLNYDDIIKQYD